jgi:hypothetical protein
MTWARRRCLVAAFTLCVAGMAPAQNRDEPLLTVKLPDGRSKTFTRQELEALPAERASAQLRDAAATTVTGVSVATLLKLSGLDLSANLGGGFVARHALVARAGDGYLAVFGLADVDPRFERPPLLVSWTNADGSALPARVGPLQLIATGERRPTRWVRQLQAIEVTPLP